jgi:hypothetical protein
MWFIVLTKLCFGLDGVTHFDEIQKRWKQEKKVKYTLHYPKYTWIQVV